MAEYKYVTLPPVDTKKRGVSTEDQASEELNRLYVSQGWTVVNATRPSPIGPIGFLLVR